MSKTTQEWQQLLDGTTGGPWEWIDEPDDAHAQYIVDRKTGRMCISVEAIGFGSVYEPSDPLLAAAAPEAVAEVVRLRRELEQLRDMYDALATGDCAVASQHRNSRDALTRILEGDSNDH